MTNLQVLVLGSQVLVFKKSVLDNTAYTTLNKLPGWKN